MTSSLAEFVVGDDDTGFNRKRMSTNGRAAEFFRVFDCRESVIGAEVDAVVVVVVVVELETTMKSVGGLT